MTKSEERIEWVNPKKISQQVKQKMEEYNITMLGVCRKNSVTIARIGTDIICPEMNDDLCSDMDVCIHDAVEPEPAITIFLCSPELKDLLQNLKLLFFEKTDKISEKEAKKRTKKFDKFRKQAFAKLKFELTKRVAAANPNIKALNDALMEEFGISTTPPELIAVFNMELKKNEAKKAGMKFSDYLLKQAEAKKK